MYSQGEPQYSHHAGSQQEIEGPSPYNILVLSISGVETGKILLRQM
jgi:hypothetical protein